MTSPFTVCVYQYGTPHRVAVDTHTHKDQSVVEGILGGPRISTCPDGVPETCVSSTDPGQVAAGIGFGTAAPSSRGALTLSKVTDVTHLR